MLKPAIALNPLRENVRKFASDDKSSGSLEPESYSPSGNNDSQKSPDKKKKSLK